MAKIYYNPNKDELIPIGEERRRRRSCVEEGSFLYYTIKVLLVLLLTAAFFAAEIFFTYEWFVHFSFPWVWGALMVVVLLVYGGLLCAIVDPDFIIF